MQIGKISTSTGSAIIAEFRRDNWRDLTAGASITSMGAAAAVLSAGSLHELLEACPEVDLDTSMLLPPIDENARILCAGFNFRAHSTETGPEAPTRPTFFSRYPSSFVGSGQSLIRPLVSATLDWEGEVAFMIGKGGRHIAIESAMGHVAAYCPMGEHSVREYQLHGTQATAGKNFDRCGAFGPYVKASSECPHPAELEVLTYLNGEKMQHGRLSDLIFDIPTLVNYVSTFLTLRPGDIIATGTPAGIGARMNPPRWLQPGDIITVEVPGVGTLTNSIVDEASGC